MKKTLLISALIVTASAILLAGSPVLAYSPRQGDLIKVSGNPAVYYVDGNGYRHLFSTESTFFSWYTGSWRDQYVQTVASSNFNLIPSSDNITVRPGYSLVRFANSLVMYAVLPGARLCHAPAYYGNYQYNRALAIPVGFQADYYNDANCDITPAVNLPDGTLLSYIDSNDIYYIQNGQRRLITASGMTANNFHNESVVKNIDPSMSYPDGPVLDGRDSKINDLTAYLYNSNSNYNNNYSYNYGYCAENWSCNSWSTCTYGSQYRSCYDANNCGTTASKPVTSQSCNTCQTNWSCTGWTNCKSGSQTRSCIDLSNCGTNSGKPALSQSCS